MSAYTEEYYVYVLFRLNGIPFYVGKGCGQRILKHEWEARAGKEGHRYNIIRQILATGIDVPKIKLHVGLTNAVAKAYEKALVAAIGREPRGPLVNLTDAGDGSNGYVPTPEARAKIAAGNRGKKFSDEHKAKLRAANLGKTLPPKTRAKIAAAKRGRKRSAEFCAKQSARMTGRKLSPEHIAKAAAGQRGHKVSPQTRAKLAAASAAYWALRPIEARSPTAETRARMSAATSAYYARHRQEAAAANLPLPCSKPSAAHGASRAVTRASSAAISAST